MEVIQFIHSFAPWLREDRREVLLRRAVDEPVPAVEEHVHEVRDLTRADVKIENRIPVRRSRTGSSS